MRMTRLTSDVEEHQIADLMSLPRKASKKTMQRIAAWIRDDVLGAVEREPTLAAPTRLHTQATPTPDDIREKKLDAIMLAQAKADLAREIKIHQEQVKDKRAPIYRRWA